MSCLFFVPNSHLDVSASGAFVLVGENFDKQQERKDTPLKVCPDTCETTITQVKRVT